MQCGMNADSEGLPERSEVELVRPAAWLAVQGPVGIGYIIRRKQSVFSLRRNEVWEPAARILAADDAVDDDMGDMYSLRAKLPREALSDGAQGSLGRGKSEKGGRARKDAVAPV